MRASLALFAPWLAVLTLAACAPDKAPPRISVAKLAAQYTAAWCSKDPARVAAFYAPNGSLAINGGTPSVGRAAIAEAARGFMTAFPDMVVTMDDLFPQGTGYVYRWTLTGTNTGPGGTGKRVHISGQEKWEIGADGLIAKSLGSFDAAEYKRQLAEGAPKAAEPPGRAPKRRRSARHRGGGPRAPRGAVVPPYSLRNATSGSTRAARRAGIQHASSATLASSAEMPT